MYGPEDQKLQERFRASAERALISKLQPRFWFARMAVALC